MDADGSNQLSMFESSHLHVSEVWTSHFSAEATLLAQSLSWGFKIPWSYFDPPVHIHFKIVEILLLVLIHK